MDPAVKGQWHGAGSSGIPGITAVQRLIGGLPVLPHGGVLMGTNLSTGIGRIVDIRNIEEMRVVEFDKLKTVGRFLSYCRLLDTHVEKSVKIALETSTMNIWTSYTPSGFSKAHV